MKFSELVLYILTKALYRTEIAQSKEMKSSLTSIEDYEEYRSKELPRIIEAINRYHVDIRGKTLVDFGCYDGALSQRYIYEGVYKVIGVDIDKIAITRARQTHASPKLSFVLSTVDRIPLEDNTVDVIVSYDVFEHVSRPKKISQELYRVLKPQGKVLIGTCGWYHPFAPHLWSVMPVPWAHVFFSERTLLRTCRRIYHSRWYVSNMHDFDSEGNRLLDKYAHEEISTDYLNKLLIRDYERIFREAGFRYHVHLLPFSSKYARWSRIFLSIPWLREFLTAYVWFILTKPKR